MCLAVVACGADDGLDPELVGRWESGQVGAPDERVTFEDNGVVSLENFGPESDDPVFAGAWSVSGSELSISATSERGTQASYQVSYFVGGDALGLAALLPVGAHVGLVGTWQAIMRTVIDSPDDLGDRSIDGIMTVTLNADQTALYQWADGDGAPIESHDAMWDRDAEQPDRIVVSYAITGGDVSLRFTEIGDDALAGTVYRRVR
jgi:hypothetical protein